MVSRGCAEQETELFGHDRTLYILAMGIRQNRSPRLRAKIRQKQVRIRIKR
jgi:hypothetical protein